jgi:hypothetical protein
MPKRIVDGEGIWKSDKIAQVELPLYRAEFANLLQLALANGSFECNARAIWTTCYGYNRPDVTPEDVAAILDEFERVKLLFRWTVSGKTWGFWVGIDKPGRLPSEARLNGRHDRKGEEVSKDKLREFLGENKTETIGMPSDSPTGSHERKGNGLGSGFGSGVGSGEGNEQSPKSPGEFDEKQNPPSSQNQNLSAKKKKKFRIENSCRTWLRITEKLTERSSTIRLF